MKKISIVIPVFNEEDNVGLVHDELLATLLKRPDWDYEIIFVDDGSTDKSLASMKDLLGVDQKTVVIELSRNYGQTAAMYAGFQASSGEVIVPLDADGQNVPADIFQLVDKLAEGFECVSGWRRDRKDKGLSRRVPSWAANRIISKTTGISLHDSGCTLKAYDADVLKSIPLYGEMHRLIPFYVYLAGGRITEMEVGHRPRMSGQSKYGISRTFRVLQDIIVAKVQSDFARRPMHLFGSIGSVLILSGFVLALFAFILKIFSVRNLVDTPLLVLSTLLVLGGLQLVISGLVTEIIIRKLQLGVSDTPYKARNTFSHATETLFTGRPEHLGTRHVE